MNGITTFRKSIGHTVDVVASTATGRSTFHGTLLSCSTSSIWLVDGDADVIVPMAQVCELLPV